MNIEDLAALAKKLEDRSAELEAMRATQAAVAQGLSDIVVLLERMEKAQIAHAAAMVQAIVAGLSAVKVTADFTMPPIDVPASTVMPAPPHGDADIEFVEGRGGKITGAKVRRVNGH